MPSLDRHSKPNAARHRFQDFRGFAIVSIGTQFHRQDRREDQGAADQAEGGQAFVEEQRAEETGEERFGGEEDRRLRRRRMALADDLEG